MAATNYPMNEALFPARQAKDTLRAVQAAYDKLAHVRGWMVAMKDTAASGDAVFATIATACGFADNASAAAAFAQIDAAYQAMTANNTVQQCLDQLLP